MREVGDLLRANGDMKQADIFDSDKVTHLALRTHGRPAGHLIATIVAVIALSGCYPSLLVSRPRAEIIVTDESGMPLEGATVTLGTMERHGIVGQNTFQKFLTDREGRVEFGKQHDWAIQIMLPDGDISYA
jgi:hypothetical protein